MFSCNIERHFATRTRSQEGCGARSTGSASAAGQLQTAERCCIREARQLRPLSYLGAVAALASQRLHAAATSSKVSLVRAEVGRGARRISLTGSVATSKPRACASVRSIARSRACKYRRAAETRPEGTLPNASAVHFRQSVAQPPPCMQPDTCTANQSDCRIKR